MELNKNTELRTDEVRDILKRMPHWTIRWGLTILLGVVFLLLVFSYLFRYPDLIRCEGVISATNPPAEIKARSTGKITGLFVKSDELVTAGQTLALIENPASLDDMQKVGSALQSLGVFVGSFDMADWVELPGDVTLGEVQSPYTDLSKLLSDYRFFITQQYYLDRLDALDGQIAMQQQLLHQLVVQLKLEEQRLKLAANSFTRDSLLFMKNTIPAHEYEQALSERISAQMAFEAIQYQLVSTRSGIYNLQQQKASLQLDYENQMKEYKAEITRAYSLLQSAIGHWYLSYVLQSPVDGTVSANRVWAVNQNVTAGDIVMTIVPCDSLEITGKAYVPIEGAGKVKQGQRVNLKLANYPYMEYGMVIGEVVQIAPVPVNDFYTVEIELPKTLITNYGIKLEMQQELRGQCEIITNDLRLIERIIYPLKALIEKNRR